MSHRIVAPLFFLAALATPAVASAATACEEIAALPDGPEQARCKRIAKRTIDGLGKASLYTTTSRDRRWTRYVVVVEQDGARRLSEPVDVLDADKLSPKLRALVIAGKPAAALEVKARYVSTETGRRYHRFSYLVVGAGDASDVVELGGPSTECTARLANDGTITHACEAEIAIVI